MIEGPSIDKHTSFFHLKINVHQLFSNVFKLINVKVSEIKYAANKQAKTKWHMYNGRNHIKEMCRNYMIGPHIFLIKSRMTEQMYIFCSFYFNVLLNINVLPEDFIKIQIWVQ